MIIFLNGSINSGKSTVSKLLSNKVSRSAIIEIDALRGFIPDVSLEDSIPLNLENAVSVARNFVSHGFNVIIPYPLSRENYNFLRNSLQDLNQELHFFTLAPSLEKAQSDTDNRRLDEWERERIKHHYAIGIPNPNFGEIIDSTNQTPDETTADILSRLKLHE